MLYCFARPNQMVGHRFTDDVAIVRAINKKVAIKKLSRLYADITEDEIQKVSMKSCGKVAILTDY